METRMNTTTNLERADTAIAALSVALEELAATTTPPSDGSAYRRHAIRHLQNALTEARHLREWMTW